MTDENLDKLMRKVLIDALRMEWSDALNESPTMSTTKEFQHLHQILLGKQHLKSFFSVQNDSF